MEQKIKYKIMKLKSGEEIISQIINSTRDKLILDKPMCFKSIIMQDYYGNPKEILVMKNWIPLSLENKIEIPKDFVLSYMTPNDDAIKLYEGEKNKEKHKGKISDVKNELPSDDEEFKKMLKYLSDNTQKLDDIMNNAEPPDKEENEPKKKQSKEDMVFMNMMFPPEMLIDLIESEILDPELFGEMYQDMKKNMKKKPKPTNSAKKKESKKPIKENQTDKYTGDDKNHKDYGNRWTDWNPDLSSEDYK